jgi:hypothetical protein
MDLSSGKNPCISAVSADLSRQHDLSSATRGRRRRAVPARWRCGVDGNGVLRLRVGGVV